MCDREFNLLDEKWIRVLDGDYQLCEVSLVDAICRAHEYRDLAGEMPTQDVAVLRLLLAVLLTIFLRKDPDGEEEEVTVDNAVDRWMALWRRGSFPEDMIREYLEQYRDRFWLFDPELPFYQVPSAAIGTKYEASKLNGEMAESSNKARLFPVRTGDGKNILTYAEAARWLLYTNAYDDTSAKPKGKNKPSSGAGWLGKLGLIFAHGRTLFETLMLNMTLLKDGQKTWGEPLPIWEDKLHEEERELIVMPDNLPELLTLQSRRLLLSRNGDHVVGFALLGGDFFEKQDAFSEQMTVWRADRKGNKKDGKIEGWSPRRHDPARQIWRDLPLIISRDDSAHQPGVVSWIAELSSQDEKSLFSSEGRIADLKIVSVKYGDKDFFVTDVFSDVLSFSSSILAKTDQRSIGVVDHEIDRCKDIADLCGDLAGEVFIASGGDAEKKQKIKADARERFYFRVDAPFRDWLISFDPTLGDVALNEKTEQWHDRSKMIACALANEIASSAGSAAFAGRTIVDSKTQQKKHHSVPEAMNIFLSKLSKK